ncbi:MAG: hypothetical protein AAGA65_08620 [Actinomycetota bacterium]
MSKRTMTPRVLAGAVLWAAGLATVLGLATGRDRAISLQVWIIGFSVWLTAVLLIRLFDGLPAVPAQLLGIVPLRRQRPEPVDRRPFGLRSFEGLLIRARDHERTTVSQLRPQLQELADHHLPRRHGIDPDANPGRVRELFGEVAWLLDPAVTDRAASLQEVETFIDRLLPVDQTDRSRPV